MAISNDDAKAKPTDQTIRLFGDVLRAEAEAILQAASRLGPEVDDAIQLLLESKGRVIFTGLGKTGYVARKAAATFCSTGTPAIFLHPSEALHGDLGVVSAGDVLIVVSNSGETAEVIKLLPHMVRLGIPIIALTGAPNSSLAVRSNVTLDTGVAVEADEISITPTSSTTVAMSMCDAIAVTLMRHRGFTREQFAIFHPGGNLGKKLLLKVSDLMRIGDAIPKIAGQKRLADAIKTISEKQLGAVFVVSGQDQLDGVLTDGDLRRIFEQHSASSDENPTEQIVSKFMTQPAKQIVADALAAAALKSMEDYQITVLAVIDTEDKLVGVIHLHDLIRAGLA
jgi:arabinose-5-phosphate isomerase